MSDAMLPLKQRLKLLRQSVYAALSFRGHVPLAIEDCPLGAAIQVKDATVYVPSALRWKLYKKGWCARLDQLEREYGVGRHVVLGPESVVIDIGANVGEFAHIAARYGARIICIEPDPFIEYRSGFPSRSRSPTNTRESAPGVKGPAKSLVV